MLNKIIIKNRIDLISYFYYMLINIIKFKTFLGMYKRKTRVINIYNNKIRKNQKWQSLNSKKKYILKNINWQFMIKR